MRTTLTALTEELKRLKAAGVRSVSVSPESVQRLRKAVEQQRAAVPAPARRPESVTPAPVNPVSKAEPRKTVQSTLPPPPSFDLPDGDKKTRWETLRKLVIEDETCRKNVREGKQVVFGVGNIDATIMFVGEAPGAEEERQGEPFVGPAGQLLTKMIGAMGLAREAVYIGNIMNWRPQMPVGADGEQYGNRPPTPEEMAYCLPYLEAQIDVVKPQVIVALGATAAHGLLGHEAFKALGEVRGRWQVFAGRPLMVTYHPSYILRNQSNRSKRMIWEDLLKVMEKARLPISDKQRGYFLER